MKRHALRLLLPVLVLSAVGSSADLRPDWAVMRDSLANVEPWMRRSWLAEHGLQDWYRQNSHRPESTGLSCIGRWSYGPSVKVSLRVTPDDTIVCLARGSGASIIRFRSQGSLTLDLLSDINCYGVVSRAIIKDTLVFCGMNQGGTGIEVWGVGDLTNPHRLSYVFLPPIMDIAVQDTFLYATGYVQDSLRIYSIADPRNPRRLGAVSDSGFPMCVSGGYCYLADQGGLNILDVRTPQNPHRVASIGGEILSVTVRDTLCFFGTASNGLRVYNVKNPVSPTPIGSLSGIQPADLYLPPTCDTVLYTPVFHAINIANPASPRIIGQVSCPGWDYGVAVVPALNYSLVADYFKGIVAVNITQPSVPTIDTMLFAGDQALDIHIDRNKAYVASYHAGLQVLDVTSPSSPTYLGCYDTAGASRTVGSVVASDSFAFISWPIPRMLSIDVTNPTRPLRAGECVGMFNRPEDMVLRDSFIYCAEMNRFQVVNVARPRSPVLAGSCVTQDGTYFGLTLQDTLAFIAGGPSLQIVNIANPANPQVVGNGGRPSTGVAVWDTFAYVPYPYDTLFVYSTANPAQPRLLSTTPTGVWPWDVVLGESTLYVGATTGIDVYELSNLGMPHRTGWTSVPYGVRRLHYSGGLLYAALWDAGVAVYETTTTGVAEPRSAAKPVRRPLRAVQNPVNDRVRLIGVSKGATARVYDGIGREVGVEAGEKGGSLELNVTGLGSGVYFVEVTQSTESEVLRVVRP